MFEWSYLPWLIAAFLLPIGLMAFAHFSEQSRQRKLRLFSTGALNYSEASRLRRFWSWFFWSAAISLIAFALAEPRRGVELREVSHKGRDIVFVLDVSKSMLASDITPSRLKRAKADIIDSLQRMQGHRLGLIAFAGNPKEICPLTYDTYNFIKRLRDIGPESINKGGTNIGDALRYAIDLIDSGANLGHHRDIVLITDGQDLTGYFEEAAKQAGKMGISIYTLGIGQANPTSIRLADGTYLKSAGNIVKTALNPEPLKLISELSEAGFYQSLLSSPNWMTKILDYLNQKEQAEREMDVQERKIPRYYYFLSLAFCCLGTSFLIPTRKKKK
jgi:Ca-activated chloride channel family protein